MPAWADIALQVLVIAVTVTLVLAGFWRFVARPHLDRKVAELIEATQGIEPKVTRGVKMGVSEAVRDLPESALDGTVRESTRQFLKFGSGLFENGLSSFLGTASDLQRESAQDREKPKPDAPSKR
ncbi:hypothetical protein [Marinobacter apostichopi]|uniref:hypothetical protein n=1 Tax=Marinobacter apostichopi TaxID=3035454 RepID=UPI00257429D6|nr:hypothetical protein [Marinobacter sp. LA51]